MPAIMQRFRKGNTLGTSITKLIIPSEYKAKRAVAKTWHNPYTETEKVKSEKERTKYESLLAYNRIWTGDEDRPGWRDLREEAILLKGTTCIKCGETRHPSEVQVDHIKPRARFKDQTEADSMDNLQSSAHHATELRPRLI